MTSFTGEERRAWDKYIEQLVGAGANVAHAVQDADNLLLARRLRFRADGQGTIWEEAFVCQECNVHSWNKESENRGVIWSDWWFQKP